MSKKQLSRKTTKRVPILTSDQAISMAGGPSTLLQETLGGWTAGKKQKPAKAPSKKSRSKISTQFGTSQSKGGHAKIIPAGKVFPIKKYAKPLTILRPVLTDDLNTTFKFRINPAGDLIKVSSKAASDRLFIRKNANAKGQKDQWELRIQPPKESNLNYEDYDVTFHKSPFAAYKTGLRDIWLMA